MSPSRLGHSSRLLFTLAALAVAGAAHADIPTLASRPALSLNGEWRTIVDPYEAGYYDYRWQPRDAAANPSRDAFFMDAKPRNPSDLLEYDFDKSPMLRVPGDWNTQRRELYYYEGTVWYRRKFLPAALRPGERAFLHFEAVNYRADVYLNGRKLGTHVGGFTPFSFEVTNALRPGENSLVLRVNNQRSREAVPTLNTDWWNYGGITRDVSLVTVPAVFITAHHIHLESVLTRAISGSVQLSAAEAGVAVTVNVPELGQKLTTRTDASGAASFHFVAPRRLELWTPEHPKLYHVEFRTGQDAIADEIGFRTIATRGRQILLNDRPIFLRGVALHDEFAVNGGGRVTTPAESAQLLRWAKELGCNYVRLAHYPHNESTLRAADRMGLLVWSEIPVYWTIDWDNEATYENAAAQLTDEIQRDDEHAAVIIWSVANETPVTAARTKFLSRLIARARALDPTRLISAALERHSDPHDPDVQIVEDPLANLVDFRSPRRVLPGIQDGFNRKGLISDQGIKKEAFSVLQKYYAKKAAGGQ
ncbi:MAG TPA: glycoside hydrolase family 2 TIM barrel-domain containing protein [Opitutaceae bacterium]|nr:glycoside hydrolase family 2 TIM barrel-domain containing protein [Opitutaceae bacterium]